MGLNYYFSTEVGCDSRGGMLKTTSRHLTMTVWEQTEMDRGVNWDGLGKNLLHFKERYNDPELYVTENGCAALDVPDENGFVQKDERIDYIRHHLKACHEAIQEGVRLKGYYAWSLLDNFKWSNGCRSRFGIIRVDYETLKRIPKASYYWYRGVIARNGLME